MLKPTLFFCSSFRAFSMKEKDVSTPTTRRWKGLISKVSLPTEQPMRADYFAVCVTSLLVCIAALHREKIGKPVGILLLLAYVAYISYRVAAI